MPVVMPDSIVTGSPAYYLWMIRAIAIANHDSYLERPEGRSFEQHWAAMDDTARTLVALMGDFAKYAERGLHECGVEFDARFS